MNIWSMDSGALMTKMGNLMAPVTALSITSNDAFLAVCCEDETLRVFSVCSAQELHELQGLQALLRNNISAHSEGAIFTVFGSHTEL